MKRTKRKTFSPTPEKKNPKMQLITSCHEIWSIDTHGSRSELNGSEEVRSVLEI